MNLADRNWLFEELNKADRLKRVCTEHDKIIGWRAGGGGERGGERGG